MNLQNFGTNLQMNNLWASHHTLHKDILSTDHHFGENLKNPSLTGSSQSDPLSLSEDYTSEIPDRVSISLFADLKSNTLEPEAVFNETPISVEFIDGEIEKKISIPVFNNDLHHNSQAVNFSDKNFTIGTTVVPEASAQPNIKYQDTLGTPDVNNLEINILSVGDDAAHINDISLSKVEGN
jgi:hypothetical protein